MTNTPTPPPVPAPRPLEGIAVLHACKKAVADLLGPELCEQRPGLAIEVAWVAVNEYCRVRKEYGHES